MSLRGKSGDAPAIVASTANCRNRRSGAYFIIEHIVARQHGGLSRPDNLALACWNCNLKKGPNLSGIDPGTGRMAALFNPRGDLWDEHFLPSVGALMPLGVAIQGLTPVGRATVHVLGLNDEMRQLIAVFA
jgi:hypothetical protein